MRNFLQQLRAKLPTLPKQPPAHELDRSTLLILSAVISVAIAMHFTIANIFIAVFASFVFLLKVSAIWFNKKSPPSFVMVILLVVSIGTIIYFYGGWNGKKAGISFIVLLVSLKFLESRVLRDYYVVCLLLFFLAASSFLFNSSIISILFVIVYTVAITALLFRISTPTKIQWTLSLKEASKIILKALPLAVFLFFSFPRIHGTFGIINSQDQNNSQGLEDSLVAGEMAASAFDNSLAFRVQFEGNIPPREQLYWRSKVMPVERNFQWEVLNVSKRNVTSAQLKKEALDLNNGQYRYEILHEPSRDKFIPYLDYVSGLSRGKILDDYSVFDDKPKTSLFTYNGSASLEPSLPASRKLNEAQLLNTQSVPTARLQSLIAQWRSESSTQEEIIDRAYQYFRDKPFNYSLAPPLLDEENPLDDFIFDSQTGYCEHYASAFTVLMRWSGIPARIVLGYQGGKLNKTGNYLEVRYSDAHAWSEVWINNQWQRVDPTAAISPERIEFGMDALTELWDGDRFSNNTGKALSDLLNPTGVARYLQKMRESWGNASYQWNKWVVNYDQQKQLDLLKRLGFDHKNSLVTLIGIIAIGIAGFMLFYFWQLIPKAVPLNEMQKIYRRFTNKFAKRGIYKLDGDTPEEFRLKICQQYPESDKEVGEITLAYQTLRYGRPSDDEATLMKEFKRLVKQFKLPST